MPDDFTPPLPASVIDREHIRGPFLHGTGAVLMPGELVQTGRPSHFRPDLPLAHVYFTTRTETAAWGAELAAALGAGRDSTATTARIYEVEPTGPFEDDSNVTDKRFPGNPTRFHRSRDPPRIVAEVKDWTLHTQQELQAMLTSLARLRSDGLDVVHD